MKLETELMKRVRGHINVVRRISMLINPFLLLGERVSCLLFGLVVVVVCTSIASCTGWLYLIF